MHPRQPDSLKTSTDESYSGEVKFLRERRGFCIIVRKLNDALLWLTIEGVPGKIDVQSWLSAFGVPQPQLDSFRDRWQHRLQESFRNMKTFSGQLLQTTFESRERKC